MKRFVVIAGICLTVGLGVSGCASGTPSQAPQSTVSSAGASLAKEGDKLTDTDQQANLFNGSGVKVTIEPAAKTARFQLVDPSSGKDFSDYYVFDYAKQTMLCHRLVSAMQKEYDYTLKLDTGELVTVVDGQGNDAIKTLKERGMFDKAQKDRGQERGDLEAWFQKRYGKTIEEAATP